jgi:sulfur carrier protein
MSAIPLQSDLVSPAHDFISLLVNGEPVSTATGTSLQGLIEQLKFNPLWIAVELNGNLVVREQHRQTILRVDDRIEIVTLRGGG